MDRCALEFIARRWWKRAEVWAIAVLLVVGGAVLGYQAAYWALADKQSNQITDVRKAYDTAMEERDRRLEERDRRLEELTRKTGTAADKATKAATTAAQAADKADEALNRVGQ